MIVIDKIYKNVSSLIRISDHFINVTYLKFYLMHYELTKEHIQYTFNKTPNCLKIQHVVRWDGIFEKSRETTSLM